MPKNHNGMVTPLQKQKLVEFLEQNPGLTRNSSTKYIGRTASFVLYTELKDILNRLGPGKDVKGWKGCIKDIKFNVKKKLTANLMALNDAPNNAKPMMLTAMEEKFCSIFSLDEKVCVPRDDPASSDDHTHSPQPIEIVEEDDVECVEEMASDEHETSSQAWTKHTIIDEPPEEDSLAHFQGVQMIQLLRRIADGAEADRKAAAQARQAAAKDRKIIIQLLSKLVDIP